MLLRLEEFRWVVPNTWSGIVEKKEHHYAGRPGLNLQREVENGVQELFWYTPHATLGAQGR